MKCSVMSITANEPGRPPTTETKQKLGIEIEVENMTNTDISEVSAVRPYWNLVSDGSLRNHGAEFVSYVLPVESVEPALQGFYSLWKTRHLQSTIRCGIHVHMNCLNFYLHELAGVFTTYSLLEPLLMDYCGDLREENIYCVPWYRATTEPSNAASLVNPPDNARFVHLRQTVASACKYSALNFGPISRFGTIEFRHAPTWETIDPTFKWVKILLKLMEYGARRQPQEILEAWHQDPELWYRKVLGDVCPPIVLRPLVLKTEELGAVSVAEKFLPPTKTKIKDWATPPLYVEGDGTARYAITRPPEIELRGVEAPAVPRRMRVTPFPEVAAEGAEVREQTEASSSLGSLFDTWRTIADNPSLATATTQFTDYTRELNRRVWPTRRS